MTIAADYMGTVKKYFDFLIRDYDFITAEAPIRPNAFYDIRYQFRDTTVSISYEGEEDYLLVVVFAGLTIEHFFKFKVGDQLPETMFKSANELRLYLKDFA